MEKPVQYALDFTTITRDAELRQKTQATNPRKNHTVHGTFSHQIIHTASPDSTLHHVVTGAMAHPIKRRAENGDYYMIAYVSIPYAWKDVVSQSVMDLWDISFIGPAGQIQQLPPALSYVKEVIESDFYIGFDWLWLTRNDVLSPEVNEPPQPDAPYIINKLKAFVESMRELNKVTR
jgi:hypothetical protein